MMRCICTVAASFTAEEIGAIVIPAPLVGEPVVEKIRGTTTTSDEDCSLQIIIRDWDRPGECSPLCCHSLPNHKL